MKNKKNLSEGKKIKKRNANVKHRNMSETYRETKKNTYDYYKRKNLLNHLINCAEKLQNVCLNKLVFKYYETFLNV